MNDSNINNIAGDHHVTVGNDNQSIADSYNAYNTNTNSNNTTHHANTNSGNYTYNTYYAHSNSSNTYNSNGITRNMNMYRDHRTGNTVSDYQYEQRSDHLQNYHSTQPPVGRSDQPTVHGPSSSSSQTQYRSGGYVEREYVNDDNTERVGGEHDPNADSAYYDEVDEGMSQPCLTKRCQTDCSS
ncbi:hypothetical protein K435DRAFT_47206 [Dendrothele bispora CBS 962.96]|uniref:Uncharacterized protein n=1 Tax=Dendrothele bispora (strain CBS 962.96) TaxID=1314807 RepID=A0A4S8KSE8_DENBC|nr:hypothetical protein K435DRAFT_47206 [Dendrothele bispora CBS 962.96]